jgi:hypothetical protein
MSPLGPKRAVLVVVAATLALASACTPRPQARMVGVSAVEIHDETTTVLVLVKLSNPTDEPLVLAGLDYEVMAKDWFTARGSYALSRILLPGESDYIEIPLPVKTWEAALGAPSAALEGVHYELRGKIRAWRGNREASWEVHQEGAIEPIAQVGPEVRGPGARGKITIKARVP